MKKIDRARQLRANMTDAERRLWSRLRHRQLYGHKFRRQVPVGPYIVDFACVQNGLIVEVDGGQHADEVPYDERRSMVLKRRGYRVLRFWNGDVLGRTDDVVEAIVGALLSGPPP
jgi:very-short-patch-repair endonuclease